MLSQISRLQDLVFRVAEFTTPAPAPQSWTMALIELPRGCDFAREQSRACP
jgi:hypothetical protein